MSDLLLDIDALLQRIQALPETARVVHSHYLATLVNIQLLNRRMVKRGKQWTLEDAH